MLCPKVGIADAGSAYCSNGALDSLFIATNFEEGDTVPAQENEENDDNALMRFEWVEILIRVAIEKFIRDKAVTDNVCDAFIMLCEQHLSRLPLGASIDSNEFREQRLYTAEVDALLQVSTPPARRASHLPCRIFRDMLYCAVACVQHLIPLSKLPLL